MSGEIEECVFPSLKLLKNTINLDATIESISIFFCFTRLKFFYF